MAKKLSFQERVDAYCKEVEAIGEKYNVEVSAVVDFPNRKKPPILSRIALLFATLQGGRTGLRFSKREK